MKPRAESALAIAVGLAALILTVGEVAARYVPHTWIQRDGRFYVNVNTTLVEGASVDQGEFCASWYEGNLGWNRNLDEGWSNVSLGRDGEHLPKHPILLPLLSTPLFWAFGLHGTLVFNVLLFRARRRGGLRARAAARLGRRGRLRRPGAAARHGDPRSRLRLSRRRPDAGALHRRLRAHLRAARPPRRPPDRRVRGAAPDHAALGPLARARRRGAGRLAHAQARARRRRDPARPLRAGQHLALRHALVERLQPRARRGRRTASGRRRGRRLRRALRSGPGGALARALRRLAPTDADLRRGPRPPLHAAAQARLRDRGHRRDRRLGRALRAVPLVRRPVPLAELRALDPRARGERRPRRARAAPPHVVAPSSRRGARVHLRARVARRLRGDARATPRARHDGRALAPARRLRAARRRPDARGRAGRRGLPRRGGPARAHHAPRGARARARRRPRSLHGRLALCGARRAPLSDLARRRGGGGLRGRHLDRRDRALGAARAALQASRAGPSSCS
ncbi:MAG: hypothetical protein M5U28_01870 [Sandaracinaceae bacterium]|nr:hypothetical protein [Sandaracinaceae bacterium]